MASASWRQCFPPALTVVDEGKPADGVEVVRSPHAGAMRAIEVM
jgi:hypothetical protein